MSPRRNASIKAEISFEGGRRVVPCIIRDVSEGGARIEVATVIGIPNTFDLIIPGHKNHSCRVAWRALKEMGLQYRT